jgi:hypothetical protein
MLRTLAFAVFVLLQSAAPGWASSLEIFEGSLGGPGVTAQFPTGTGLVAEIDIDASSAEGGSLRFGASEIRIVPLGSAVLTAFSCELVGCTQGVDYLFKAGAAETGSIIVTDSNVNRESGLLALGSIQWNSGPSGILYLTGCNYTDAHGVERSCDPFVLATALPEPALGTALPPALGLLCGLARRRRS